MECQFRSFPCAGSVSGENRRSDQEQAGGESCIFHIAIKPLNFQFTKTASGETDDGSLDVPEKINVTGTRVSMTSYEQVVRLCGEWAHSKLIGRSRYICVTSVHGIIASRDNRELARALDEADVVTPDGMPVVWAMRSFGVKQQQRVYGPTLMLHLCEAAARDGLRIFLYGALPGTLIDLGRRLCERFPGLQITGCYSPPFRPLTEEEELDVRAKVEASGADILFVGLSTPKQEKWMRAHRDILAGLTMIGVGAAFDIHAGRIRQAPGWMQKNGLEWLFRLLVEPARLWRRYVLVTPRFLPLWFWQWLTFKAK
jgi:N-acetylglucosaminyldiphosphoundecaprenol N-acetyl-beta-D-mannosaminyltransferase